jgi:DNA-binding transcriptional LysR family regulator
MNNIDIRRLDLSLLLVFRELVRLRQTTAAATRLHITQSAVSHALRRLRDVLGDPLFVRRSDGLEPTRRALDLLPKVEALIAIAEELVSGEQAFDPASTSRTFQIAGHDLAIAPVLNPLLNRVRDIASSARVAVRPVVGRRALELLESGEVDVAFGVFGAVPTGFSAVTLCRESFCVVARHAHPQFRDGMTLDRFVASDHLLVSFRAGFVGRVDAALRREGLQRRVVTSVPAFLSALAMVSVSDVIATVPETLADAHAARFNLAVYRAPIEVEPFDIVAVRHKRSMNDAAVDWIIELAMSLVRQRRKLQ